MTLNYNKTITDVFSESCQQYPDSTAFSCMGQKLSFRELDQQCEKFAAYLQEHTSLQPGDRIAVQLPNILQYPVVVFGALRAGMIVVNTNPLYTAHELKHQL